MEPPPGGFVATQPTVGWWAHRPAGWPLLLAIGGYAAVWVLGARLLVWPAVAVALGWWLVTRRVPLRAPAGSLVWAGFVGWTLVSALTISGGGRLAAWAYRESLYLSATVVLVFCVSVPARRLPTRSVAVAVVWLFALSVALGGLGLLLPDAFVPTLVQRLLPPSLLHSQFVADQVEGRLSATATFLGEVRPVAPFGYTNEWGAAMGMLFPLTVWARGWLRTRGARVAVLGLLVVAVVPSVLSVNRGLWISVIVACAAVLVRAAAGLRARTLALTSAGLVGAVVVVRLTPLWDVVVARLERPNLGTRSTLAGDALSLVLQSPWFGYGAPQPPAVTAGTNDVSVGTHGQLFTLLVSQGLPGTVLYLGFLVTLLAVTWRVGARSWWAWSALVVLLVQAPFYNALPVPLVLGFVAAAMCLRDPRVARATTSRHPPGVLMSELSVLPSESARTVRPVDYARAVRRRAWLVLLCGVLGALVTVLLLPAGAYPSTASVEVRQGYVDLSSPPTSASPNMVTEQQVAVSSDVLQAVADQVGGAVTPAELRRDGSVTSPPGSTTLVFVVRDDDADRAREVVSAWSAVYLQQRASALDSALRADLSDARKRMNTLRRQVADSRLRKDGTVAGTRSAEVADLQLANLSAQLEATRQSYNRLSVLDVDPGRSLGRASDPVSAGGLGPVTLAALGGLAGLVVGCLLAVALGRADRRLTDLDEVGGVDAWTSGDGRDEEDDSARLVAAHLALRHRRDGVGRAALVPMTGPEPRMLPEVVCGLHDLGVRVRLLADAHEVFAAEVGPTAGELVLVGTVGALEDTTSVALAAQMDVVVLVADRGHVDRPDVEGVLVRLGRSGAVVDGIVLVGRPVSSMRLAWRRRTRGRAGQPTHAASTPSHSASQRSGV